MNVLFVSSEAIPYSKTGGLADVAGTLPRILAGDHTVTLAVPLHGGRNAAPADAVKTGTLEVEIGTHRHEVDIYTLTLSRHFKVILVSQDLFFARDFLYGDASGDYRDNFERFLCFQKSLVGFLERPRRAFEIVHANDWQTALLPLLWRFPARRRRPAFVFTIHNIGYQGLFDPRYFGLLDLPRDLFTPDSLEFYGRLNCLKAGIVFSDAVTTVSPTYAREIRQPEFGAGLDGVLVRFQHKLSGILNGVDYGTWDPRHDPLIARNYTSGHLEDKSENKRALLRELRLPGSGDKPLAVAITRLSVQKGIELILEALDGWKQLPFHLVVLGQGDRLYEERLTRLAATRRGVRFIPGFDESLAHRLQAAADMLWMPSQYEPCGLTQLYAMRYGTVPVVRATGGLADTVRPVGPHADRGTGFTFGPFTAAALKAAVDDALSWYARPDDWRKIQKRGMAADFSWEKSAERYTRLYQTVLKRRD